MSNLISSSSNNRINNNNNNGEQFNISSIVLYVIENTQYQVVRNAICSFKPCNLQRYYILRINLKPLFGLNSFSSNFNRISFLYYST